MTHQDSRTFVRRALPCLLILCSAACAKGDDIVGDLVNALDSGTNAFSNNYPTQLYDGWASAFTMGANSYWLTGIQIVLNGGIAGITGAPVFQLESTNGAPSDIDVVTLSNPNPVFSVISTGILTFTFTPDTPVILQANTTYWLTGTSTTNTVTKWENTTSAFSGDGAVYGQANPLQNPYPKDATQNDSIWGGLTGNENADMFEVDGTLIPASTPEPGSAGLAVIGLSLCFVAVCWKTLARRRAGKRAASAL